MTSRRGQVLIPVLFCTLPFMACRREEPPKPVVPPKLIVDGAVARHQDAAVKTSTRPGSRCIPRSKVAPAGELGVTRGTVPQIPSDHGSQVCDAVPQVDENVRTVSQSTAHKAAIKTKAINSPQRHAVPWRGIVIDAKTRRSITSYRLIVTRAGRSAQVLTSNRAAFEINLTPGPYVMQIDAVGYARRTVIVTISSRHAQENDNRVETFALQPGASVWGTVVNQHGIGVANLPVRCAGIATVTAENGTFRIEGIGQGTHAIQVRLADGSLFVGETIAVRGGQSVGPVRVGPIP